MSPDLILSRAAVAGRGWSKKRQLRSYINIFLYIYLREPWALDLYKPGSSRKTPVSLESEAYQVRKLQT